MHYAFNLSPSDKECIPHVEPGGNWRSLPDKIRGKRFANIRRYDATTMLKRPLWTKPSYTITTKFNDATAGAFIHPQQNRTFSLREGARLQSFPDSYRFAGSAAEIRKLIGNAVPPLLAERIALAIAPEVFDVAGMPSNAPKPISRTLLSERCTVDDLLGLKPKDRDPCSAQLHLFD